MNCFICGAYYDENIRPEVVVVKGRKDKKDYPIKDAKYKDKRLKLCPDCLRAFVYGYLFQSEDYELKYEYEEDGDV